MVTLALDTSSTSASAALVNDYIVMAEFSVTLADLKGSGRKTHSETLMPMVNQIFEVSGLSLDDVDRIACTCGPGSFTGLRIGAATAKGLAFATGKPLIAVPTLDAMAYSIECKYVVPMMDARRGQVYSAIYQDGTRTSNYMALPIEELLTMINPKEAIFTGDGAIVHREIIGGRIIEKPLIASDVAAIARKMPDAKEEEFSLLYIRKPQAEREREERGC